LPAGALSAGGYSELIEEGTPRFEGPGPMQLLQGFGNDLIADFVIDT
jgi:hypothetical protein